MQFGHSDDEPARTPRNKDPRKQARRRLRTSAVVDYVLFESRPAGNSRRLEMTNNRHLAAPQAATTCPSRGSAFVRDASRDLHVPNGKTGHDIHVLADAVTGTPNVAVEHDSVGSGFCGRATSVLITRGQANHRRLRQ